MTTGFFMGLLAALQYDNVFYCLIGAILGTLIGILPGLGPSATIAMLLPFTFALSRDAALIMLAGIYYGAQYGGSTTAIMLNLPGEASSVTTALDGNQMARQGRAGIALATSAISSFVAGCVATGIIATFAPSLAELALLFGPAEYFALLLLALICAVLLSQGSVLKSVAMVLVGLILGTVGTDIATGQLRFTFGILELSDGIGFVTIAMGLFGLPEGIIAVRSQTRSTHRISGIGTIWPRLRELKEMIAPTIRGTFIGSALGILPGGGALLASFAAYATEKHISKSPEKFGQGVIAGVAAPESANNAGAQTSFIPLLTLGVPSNAVMALLAGAMLIHGVAPGPLILTQHADMFWAVVASMLVGNVILLLLNLPLIGLWVRLLSIPYHYLFPAIVLFCCIGAYTINNNWFDIVTLLIFGALGLLFTVLRCEPAPLIMGCIIGPLLEENFKRAMQLADGDILTMVSRPITAGLMVIFFAVLLVLSFGTVRKRRAALIREIEE